MRPDTQNAGRRRRGGAGGARNRRPGGPSENATTRAPHKPTLWERFLGIFGGGKQKPSSSRPTMRETRIPSGERSERSDRGERSERGDRDDRQDRFSDTPRPSRKPELVEVTSPKLYVGNLSFDAAENDLFDLFRGVGDVQNAEIVSHRHTQKSKGFAFVMMNTVDEARRAVIELHDKEFMGRKLVVSGAKTSDVRNYGESDSEAA